MKISIYRQRCCGSGICTTIMPEFFEQHEDDGLVVMRNSDSVSINEECARAVASACPTSAIVLE
ncbi:ferredoxin [Streptomyces sp. NPDC058664]|uniref:ferredoxin n=1 Tax=unclassified Streptomyces TaxID=2593676 RepID=UPI00366990DA